MPEIIHDETRIPVSIVLRVNRVRALGRGLIWLAAVAPPLLIVVLLFSRLDFTRTGVHSLLVEASLALMALPIGAGAFVCAFRGVQYLLLGFWIGETGIEADAHQLTLRLGPFGTRIYPVSELDIKYPFELSGDEESFEAFLPEETQRATMLPRILHPLAKEPINRVILRFAAGTEADLVSLMRPWFENVTEHAPKHPSESPELRRAEPVAPGSLPSVR